MRSLPFVIAGLAALVGLAGCIDQDARTGPQAAPQGTWSFSQSLIDKGADYESSVLAGPDGLLLACSHGGFSRPSPTWVSRDSGTTWSPLEPGPNPIVSGDCDWALLDDGTWAVVYDTLVSATVAATQDEGKTWSVDFAGAIPFGGVDRPWLAGSGDTLYLAYANIMAEEPAISSLGVSHDHGRTWTEHHIVHTFAGGGTDFPNTVIGHPLVDGDTVRIPLAGNNMARAAVGGSVPTMLALATSRDGGATWTEQPIAGPYPSYVHLPSVDQAHDGTLFAAKASGPMGDMALDVLVSQDDGATWTPIHVADHAAFVSVTTPWVDARPDGTADLVWMQVDLAHGTRGIWGARLSADRVLVPAGPLMPMVADASGFEFVSVDHDAQGRAFIVYPMDTGDCTAPGPAQPGRNAQCLWLLAEDVTEQDGEDEPARP